MAAVRAGALGLSRSSRCTVYASTGLHGASWEQREEGSALVSSKAKGKGYGISVTSPEQAHKRWKSRKNMLDLKLKVADWTLLLAVAGLILAIVDVELCATGVPVDSLLFHTVSYALRLGVILSTIVLQILIIAYHCADVKIYLIETGSKWQIGLTSERVSKVVLELVICAICPLPETGNVNWPMLGATPDVTERRVEVPWNVLLVLPMFLRLFILARYVVLHSSQYQDPASRTIASLNQVAVDFPFVVKSSLYDRPLFYLSLSTVCFWFVIAWMLTQCERYAYESMSTVHHFLDFIWFEIITFFSIGYGDIQVKTYCGRGLAMLTAIVGTLFSSILIALMGRRMALTLSEKRVNHLIAESQLTMIHKNDAARVLQWTWRTVLRQRDFDHQPSPRNTTRLRDAQRCLLRCIINFRRARWRLRMQMEDEDDYFAVRRSFMETEERLSRVRKRQAQLKGQMMILFEHVQALTALIQ